MFESTIADHAAPTGEPTPWQRPRALCSIDGLAQVLDEIDYGVILVSHTLRVKYLNHTARIALRANHPLCIEDDVLRAADPGHAQRLRCAIVAAAERTTRSLVTLQTSEGLVTVSVVPIGLVSSDVKSTVLLVLGRHNVCARLSADRFAHGHGLTAAESSVLTALADGLEPSQIARMHGVALATIRTQIQSIRDKTGASCIRELLLRVAMLPPLVNALRC